MKTFNEDQAAKIVQSIYKIEAVDIQSYQEVEHLIIDTLIEEFGSGKSVFSFIEFGMPTVIAKIHMDYMKKQADQFYANKATDMPNDFFDKL